MKRAAACALAAVPLGVRAAGSQTALLPAGPQAASIHDLWLLMLWICSGVFVAVMAALLAALLRAPRAADTTPADLTSLRQSETGSARAVAVASAATLVLLLALMVASLSTDRALARLPLADAVHVEVIGHQWWWEVKYRFPEPALVFTTANEMHVPVGRPVVVELKSADVIHSFWVPNLHGKMDLIPGRSTRIRLRADRPGSYRGQCAEFCGYQHAHMAFHVIAESEADFERWLARQRAPAAPPSDALQQRGQALFLGGSCAMCHAVQGTPAQGKAGPDLTHVASRPSLAAGTLPNAAPYLAAWIVDPHAAKPGVNMPSHTLEAADLDALLAYVGSLK